MTGLDTNVLVRFLVADDAKQAHAASKFIEESRRSGEPLFLSVLVLCETVWVLDRSYQHQKAAIIDTLEQILDTGTFVIEKENLVRGSVEEFKTGRGSFADYLIGSIARQAGCTETVTFDRKLSDAAGFRVL